jgi:putative ABC transport system permease protein
MSRKPNNSLFLRLWLRALTVKRPQAGLGVAAVLLGAALAAALLNLHDGVRRKMTQEFRSYGANVIVSPRDESSGELLGQDVLSGLTSWRERTPGAVIAPMLHVVMRLRPAKIDERLPEFQNVVVVGTDFESLRALYPSWRYSAGAHHGVPLADNADARHAAPLALASAPQAECTIGTRVARTLRLEVGSNISAEPAEAAAASAGALPCRISGILSTGGAEDDQLFVPLATLQRAAALEGKESLVELLVPGETREVERAVTEFAGILPQANVRPVRAIVESQGRVLGTIRWLLVALTALILVIVALCVMATMTALVLERKKDVAVMKALGATDRLIMRLFLCEGAGMGFTGGVLGFGLGLLLARELGMRLFGVTLAPAWWTLPVISVASTVITVLATLFPVRMAQAVQPATTLKGN